MKRLTTFFLGLAMVLGLTACSTTVAGAPAAATSSEAARPAFGPYLDISVKQPDLAALAKQTGLKHVNLAFALSNNGACEPAWGGTQPVDALKAQIDAFKAAGGSVSAATGGAVGSYLENACGSAGDLAGAYEKLLDATGTNLLDVDIETGIDTAKVVDALSQVQRTRGTDITLTLPVDLGGLPAPALDLVQRAAAANVTVTVNIMDMNFKTGGNWGQAMVDAAQATLDQLRKVYPNAEGDRLRQVARGREARVLGARPRQRHVRQEGQGPAELQRDRPVRLPVHPAVRRLHRPDGHLTTGGKAHRGMGLPDRATGHARRRTGAHVPLCRI
jgi:hypothetical protein